MKQFEDDPIGMKLLQFAQVDLVCWNLPKCLQFIEIPIFTQIWIKLFYCNLPKFDLGY